MLTLSLPRCHLKTINKSAKFEVLKYLPVSVCLSLCLSMSVSLSLSLSVCLSLSQFPLPSPFTNASNNTAADITSNNSNNDMVMHHALTSGPSDDTRSLFHSPSFFVVFIERRQQSQEAHQSEAGHGADTLVIACNHVTHHSHSLGTQRVT